MLHAFVNCAKSIISYLGKSEAVAMVPDGVDAQDAVLLPLLGRFLLDIPVKLLLLVVVAVAFVVAVVAVLLGAEHLHLGSHLAIAYRMGRR
jgi:hypothetical protein